MPKKFWAGLIMLLGTFVATAYAATKTTAESLESQIIVPVLFLVMWFSIGLIAFGVKQKQDADADG